MLSTPACGSRDPGPVITLDPGRLRSLYATNSVRISCRPAATSGRHWPLPGKTAGIVISTTLLVHVDRNTGLLAQAGELVDHLCTIHRLVGSLVAGLAAHLERITQRSLTGVRQPIGRGIDIGVVHFANHADGVPGFQARR